jgi:hypothetical protein
MLVQHSPCFAARSDPSDRCDPAERIRNRLFNSKSDLLLQVGSMMIRLHFT